MSKKYERVQQRRGVSDPSLNAKNLSSGGHKNLLPEVLWRRDSRLIVDNANNKRLDCSNSRRVFLSEDRGFEEKICCTQARNSSKRCRNSQTRNNRSRSTRRLKVTRSRKSKRQEDSSNSSDSNSDLRSTSRRANRSILSRLVQYTFYSVINTAVTMDQGTSASALCRSFLALYLKLDESSVHSNLLDSWDKAGQKIIVLKGYNHKHLQYLAKEVRHIAIDSNTLYRTTGQARVMLVLTAFGREEDMEEAFDDLCYLH